MAADDCSATATAGLVVRVFSAASTTPRSARMCSSAAVMSEGVQLAEQVGALAAEHGGQRGGIGGADGGHDLEEEVVAVAAGRDGGLGEPAVEFGASGRGEAVDDAVGLDLLGLALGVDEAVAGEPVEYLVQVADVQPAPLVADGLLEAGLELVAVGWPVRQQGQYGVVQGHASYLVTR
jgi:hypothetical protein